MKDIDFDELDKAVNSLMGGIKDQSDQPQPKTLTIATTLKENETPEYTKLEQAAQKIGSETIGGPTERMAILSEADDEDPTTTVELKTAKMTDGPLARPVATVPVTSEPAPQTPAEPTPPTTLPAKEAVAARRSSGRFMDVMHPSSDMKTSAAAVPPPSREAATIMPPERTATVETAPQPSEAPAEVAAESAQKPIESAVVSETPVEVPEPLTSPFLPDAKVEKRPLGTAASTTDPDAEGLIDQLGASQDERQKDTQLTPNPTEAADIELPEELNNNLLAIETNLAVEGPIDELSVAPAAPLAEEKKQEITGPASIPQQYQELPSSGDQSNGAIFDVDAYHKQPAHPAKSSSSWLWIVVIIIIVIVCGAGAAAFYLLGTK